MNDSFVIHEMQIYIQNMNNSYFEKLNVFNMELFMNTRLILNRLKLAKNLKNDAELARFLDLRPSTISGWTSRNSIDYDLVFSKCDDVNLHWLLTGEGERGRISDNSIIGDRNKIIGNNTEAMSGGQIIGGNNINVSLPTIGTQKIIKPNGSIEITSIASDDSSECTIEIESLKHKIQDMQALIDSMNQTISIQKDFIDSLKKRSE